MGSKHVMPVRSPSEIVTVLVTSNHCETPVASAACFVLSARPRPTETTSVNFCQYTKSKSLKLSTTDLLVLASMKNAAKRDR